MPKKFAAAVRRNSERYGRRGAIVAGELHVCAHARGMPATLHAAAAAHSDRPPALVHTSSLFLRATTESPPTRCTTSVLSQRSFFVVQSCGLLGLGAKRWQAVPAQSAATARNVRPCATLLKKGRWRYAYGAVWRGVNPRGLVQAVITDLPLICTN